MFNAAAWRPQSNTSIPPSVVFSFIAESVGPERKSAPATAKSRLATTFACFPQQMVFLESLAALVMFMIASFGTLAIPKPYSRRAGILRQPSIQRVPPEVFARPAPVLARCARQDQTEENSTLTRNRQEQQSKSPQSPGAEGCEAAAVRL